MAFPVPISPCMRPFRYGSALFTLRFCFVRQLSNLAIRPLPLRFCSTLDAFASRSFDLLRQVLRCDHYRSFALYTFRFRITAVSTWLGRRNLSPHDDYSLGTCLLISLITPAPTFPAFDLFVTSTSVSLRSTFKSCYPYRPTHHLRHICSTILAFDFASSRGGQEPLFIRLSHLLRGPFYAEVGFSHTGRP